MYNDIKLHFVHIMVLVVLPFVFVLSLPPYPPFLVKIWAFSIIYTSLVNAMKAAELLYSCTAVATYYFNHIHT